VPSGIRFLLAVAATAVLALSVGTVEHAAAAESPPECDEPATVKPARRNALDLIELQPNALRPTFDIGLGHETSGADEISLRPKAGERFGPRVAAELLDRPRKGSQALEGEIRISARPSKSGRVVIVAACLEGVSQWKAGRYEGVVAVYGPRIADFNYALVVTSKWPWQVAALLIVGTVLFSALILFFARRPAAGSAQSNAIATVAGFVVGALLAGLTYWSNYVTSDTWGDDPQAQITALVLASFSATVLGLGAVRAALTRLDGGGGGGGGGGGAGGGGGGGGGA
jgi:uncharacterized membrane protein